MTVHWRVVLVVAVAYLAGSTYSFLVLEAPSALAVFFPPSGVTLAALVLTPRSAWPWILVAAGLTEAASDMLHGMSATAALGFGVTNTAEPLVSALLLTRFVPEIDLRRRRHLGAFLAMPVLVGPLVGGFLGATTIALTLDGPWLASFPAFWSGDALGVLTVGGTILAARDVRWDRATVLRCLGVALAALVVTVVAFLPEHNPLVYLPIPLLLGIALRFGLFEVLLGGLVVTATANAVSALGFGPWGDSVLDPTAEVATLQLFLAIAVLAAWLLTVALGERDEATLLYARERESALLLQRALLPHVPDSLPGVEVGTLYRPADSAHEVGGDWYDVFPLGEHHVGIAVGDVVGHELQAAVTMGRLQASLRLAASTTPLGPSYVLTALDAATATMPDAVCSTVGYAAFDPVAGRLRYACAGHPPPLLVTGGTATYLDAGRSTPLGVGDGPREEAVEQVPDGALLVWYSDGLVEQRQHGIDEGLAKLAMAATRLDPEGSPAQWCETLLSDVMADHALEDDVVVLCLRLSQVTTGDHTGVPLSEAGA
ncbi:PP2C family protein-serine/threonine phosphatase [Nocardioides caldifontis]|uniref:PP2C family protein-serine/threonine phosphatase n=1 Tax=Nocardioides caldifontis TaxID=2588938 RepID=UPI0011DF868D|nr:SpoIIE family protein phosphatase [Nocardioides caldifontis]